MLNHYYHLEFVEVLKARRIYHLVYCLASGLIHAGGKIGGISPTPRVHDLRAPGPETGAEREHETDDANQGGQVYKNTRHCTIAR